MTGFRRKCFLHKLFTQQLCLLEHSLYSFLLQIERAENAESFETGHAVYEPQDEGINPMNEAFGKALDTSDLTLVPVLVPLHNDWPIFHA